MSLSLRLWIAVAKLSRKSQSSSLSTNEALTHHFARSSTVVSTASPMTVEGTSTLLSTTITTPTITVSRGVSVTIKTVTAPPKTITLTNWKPVITVRVTRTKDAVLTITETSTPVGASASCAAGGGVLA